MDVTKKKRGYFERYEDLGVQDGLRGNGNGSIRCYEPGVKEGKGENKGKSKGKEEIRTETGEKTGKL